MKKPLIKTSGAYRAGYYSVVTESDSENPHFPLTPKWCAWREGERRGFEELFQAPFVDRLTTTQILMICTVFVLYSGLAFYSYLLIREILK